MSDCVSDSHDGDSSTDDDMAFSPKRRTHGPLVSGLRAGDRILLKGGKKKYKYPTALSQKKRQEAKAKEKKGVTARGKRDRGGKQQQQESSDASTSEEDSDEGRNSKATSRKKKPPRVATKLFERPQSSSSSDDDSSSENDSDDGEDSDGNPLPISRIHSSRNSQLFPSSSSFILGLLEGEADQYGNGGPTAAAGGETSLNGTQHVHYDGVRAEAPLVSHTDVSLSMMLEEEHTATEGRITATNLLQDECMWDRENTDLLLAGGDDHHNTALDETDTVFGGLTDSAKKKGEKTTAKRKAAPRQSSKKGAPLVFSTPLLQRYTDTAGNERSSTFYDASGFSTTGGGGGGTSLAGLIRSSTGGGNTNATSSVGASFRLSTGGFTKNPSTAPRNIFFTPEEERKRRLEEDEGNSDLPSRLKAKRRQQEEESSPLFQRACETRATAAAANFSSAANTTNNDGTTNWDKVVKQCSAPVARFLCVDDDELPDAFPGGSTSASNETTVRLPGGPDDQAEEASSSEPVVEDWMAAMTAAMNLPAATH